MVNGNTQPEVQETRVILTMQGERRGNLEMPFRLSLHHLSSVLTRSVWEEKDSPQELGAVFAKANARVDVLLW